MKLNKFLLLLLVLNNLLAQQNTTAKIDAIKEDGLHKLVLPPEIRSFSKEQLGDFRILDSKGIEVPYYIFEGSDKMLLSNFAECKILSKMTIPKNRTTLIFENPKTTIDAIVLSITNSDLTKSYSISGSNDQKEWFGLVNNSTVNELQNHEETSVLKTINLPLTSYRFLKIDFNDKKTLPINVLKIGFFINKIKNRTHAEIFPKSIRMVQLKSPKNTQIQVVFQNPQVINQISFKISNPSLFRRNARIYSKKIVKTKRSVKSIPETISNFELSSHIQNTFSVPQIFEKECFIEIENQDSQPLTFDKIQFFQNQISVIADLKTNEKYTITTGNPKKQRPEYDLENFKNNNDNNLPEAKIYDIKHPSSQKTNIPEKSFWQQPWFMWACIGLGGIAIAFFTTSLLKDMKNNP